MMEYDTTAVFRNWKSYDKLMKAAANKHKYVVFFGCGAIFASIVETWYAQVGRQIDFCCDNDPEKWGKYFSGTQCISPEDLIKLKSDVIIFLTVGNFLPVYEQLQNEGFSDVHVLYKYDLEAAAYVRSMDAATLGAEANAARALLGDSKSIHIFDSILSRASGKNTDVSLMPKIYESAQYFPADLIKLDNNECYVDIGAYDGDTVRQFLRACDSKFDHVYALELDKSNFKKLQSNTLASPMCEKITAFNVGAWNTRESIKYQPGLTQSTIGNGSSIAEVAPLDEILNGKKITYIKMDIEGAEINALAGARNIIVSQAPKLAICVYHKISHLWEIPIFIHEMLPDHSIFLRHHTRLEYETVCYAIPKS